MEVHLERIQNWLSCRAALIAALSARRDDRCVEGLGDILEALAVGQDADAVIDALFGYGTRPALEHVLDAVRAFERTLDARKKQRKKLAAQRHQKKPGYWKGTKEAWKAREKRRIAGLVEKYDEATAVEARSTRAEGWPGPAFSPGVPHSWHYGDCRNT
ncbi:MAG: hypothetical protein CMJ89_11370 [Planctomycetes bacterium]|jgi:hypothetical protein|nr:hypothetical protein [Planctomycetota bacterium]